jgi:GTP-binding protein EngB required for normal cell division
MTSPDIIELRAIDSSGSLGSLYDRRRDCVLGRPSKTVEGQKFQLPGSIRCELIDINAEESENLLKRIGIEDDLRLNILLKSTSGIGLAQLVDHPRPPDKYTRFLYFFYVDREQRLPDDPAEARKCVKSSLRNIEATHIVTAVRLGIDVIVVLQLPCKDNTATKIDAALRKIQALLEKSNDVSSFIADNESILEKIIETKAYSNVSELTQMTSLHQICQYITETKKKSDIYRPLTYTLQPIEWLYPNANALHASYIPLEQSDIDKLEQHLIEILKQMKKLKYSLGSNASKLSPDHPREPLLKAQNEWQSLHQTYEKVIERLRKLVSDIHDGQNDASEIDDALKHEDQITLKENIRKLMKQVKDLETETRLINSSQQQLKHSGVFESQVNQNGDEKTLESKQLARNQQNQTIITNVKVINNNQSTLSIEQNKERNGNGLSPSPPSSETQTDNTTSSSTTDEIINILLLGESGVGKSTFINAFVNYLTFKTLEKAESSKPVALIPVSFVITTGNNFKEHIIKFGESDNLNNEDFDHPGQSVTQNCKSYVFNLSHINGKKLRIIDTPGFGDTRGLDQDDLNMQYILEYINNLTHLNALCFLLKPNTSQINKFFRTCLTQLLELLGPNNCQNIIFCFTNARSTFYTPGDTAPLLKDILKSLSTHNISFNKENTFCFDNESFRYLIALQKSIKFDDHDKEEYEISWSKSVHESKRLLNYVCNQLIAYPTQSTWQSIKHAQLQITYMIRPMLEAMRNILRNIIICDVDSSNRSIELIPIVLHRPAAVCFTCEHVFIQKGKFWIVRDIPHEMQTECFSCDCASSQHMPIHYKLKYKDSDKPSSHNRKEMKEQLSLLRNASAEFAHFLVSFARSSKDDPFWIGITQMIGEENDICKSRTPNEMNLKLAQNLRELLQKYEQHMNKRNSDQQHSPLPVIYEWIQTICGHPMVQIQMAAVRETQEEIMKLYEYKVPENLASTSVR